MPRCWCWLWSGRLVATIVPWFLKMLADDGGWWCLFCGDICWKRWIVGDWKYWWHLQETFTSSNLPTSYCNGTAELPRISLSNKPWRELVIPLQLWFNSDKFLLLHTSNTFSNNESSLHQWNLVMQVSWWWIPVLLAWHITPAMREHHRRFVIEQP